MVPSCKEPQFTKNKLGLDAIEAQKIIDDTTLNKIADAEFELFNQAVLLIEQLKSSFEYYIKSSQKPLFIFIDELDRAKPDYAIKFLEIIKHMFSVKGIIFVISVDENQLESIVKKTYGSKIDFNGYYRKFTTTTYNLPSVYFKDNIHNSAKINEYITKLYNEHIEIYNKNISLKYDDNHVRSTRLNTIKEISEIFNLSLRDINLFFRILVRYLAVKNQDKVLSGYIDTASFLIALQISDKEIYNSICNIKISIKPLISIIKKYQFSDYLKYTLLMSLLSDNNSDIGRKNNHLVEKELKLITKVTHEIIKMYSEYFSQFGYEDHPAIASIYKKLESLNSIFSK